MAATDCSWLHVLLHGLAARPGAWAVNDGARRVHGFTGSDSGGQLPQGTGEFAAFVAAQVLQKAANPQSVPELQQFIGEMLEAQCAPEHIRRILAQCLLAASRTAIRTQQIQKIGNFSPTTAFKPGSLIFLLFDNIGFKKMGFKCGYSQYTLLLYQEVTKELMSALGIANADPTPRPYTEAITGPENFLPTDTDYETLHTRKNAALQAAVEAVAALGDFDVESEEPDPRLLFGDSEIPSRPRALFSNGASVAEASVQQHLEREAGGDEESDEDEDEDAVVETQPYRTMGEKNGLKRREIWKEDLNSNECIVQLANELNTLADRHELDMIWAQSDGAPHYAIRKLIDTYPDQYNRIRFFGGPFHFALEAWRGLGRLFGGVFLASLISGYRGTENKRTWFLCPGDPRQTQTETPQILQGLYMAAALAFRRSADGSACDSATELWEYMLRRAREEPLVFVVILYIMFAEITISVVDSERGTAHKPRGDFELYRSAHRMMLLLWSTTNSFKYMRTTLDQEAEWLTASKREMLINELLLFTKETANGKRLFGDTFVEWNVNIVRKFEGKFDRRGLDNRLLSTVQLLDEKEKAKRHAEGRELPAKLSFGEQRATSAKIRFSDVHLAAIRFAERTRLFQVGENLRHWRPRGSLGAAIERGDPTASVAR